MKRTLTFTGLAALLAVITTGCLTVQTPVVSQTGTGTNGVPIYSTNVVTTVNTNVLQAEAGTVTILIAGATSVAVQRDTNAIPQLKTAQTVLNGILNGSNPTTTAQVLTMLQTSSNTALGGEIGPLLSTISGYEQGLLAQFGSGAQGQITIAFAKAILAGINIGLAGK